MRVGNYATRMNMAHISPWASSIGLIDGSARLLDPGAPLILYGPWLKNEIPTASSKVAFDEDLRARNPEWGIRDMETVLDVAREHGFGSEEVVAMPANNFSVVLRKG